MARCALRTALEGGFGGLRSGKEEEEEEDQHEQEQQEEGGGGPGGRGLRRLHGKQKESGTEGRERETGWYRSN